ncbi:unnamed protein product [Merluccius merluccius]
MFSESKAAGPGEQRGFKPHMPHFFPWLCSGLKAHQTGGDLGLRGPFRRGTETRLEDLAPQGKTKDKIQASEKEKPKKSAPRGNGVGLARRLPMVFRGRHILSQAKEDCTAKRDPSPEPGPNKSDPEADPPTGNRDKDEPRDLGNNGVAAQDFYSECSFVRTPGSHPNLLSTPQSDGVCSPLRKYGPLAPIPAPVPPGKATGREAPSPKGPSVASVEEEREKLCGYLRRTYQQRDPKFACWINSSTWGTIDRRRGFRSSFSCPREQSAEHSPSRRNLAGRGELPGGAGFSHRSSFKGDVFSRERPPPHADTAFTRSLPGWRKPRPKSELLQTRGREQAWVQPRSPGAVDSTNAAADAAAAATAAAAAANEPRPPGPRCSRKAVRNQIKRVVVNLEQVVGALKNVQQEMKEVVEQIDYLTSAIDLNAQEEEGKTEAGEGCRGRAAGRADVPGPSCDSRSGSVSASAAGGVTAGSSRPPMRRERGQQEQQEEAEETGSTRTSATLRRRHTKGRRSPCTPCAQTTSLTPSPRRCSPLPVRPPTPGLSPLTVNLPPPHAGVSPAHPSPLATPTPASPKPGALSLSLPHPFPVATHGQSGSCESPLSRHPSASPASSSPSPSPARPPAPSGPPGLSETLPANTGGEEEEEEESRARPAGPALSAPREGATLPEGIKDPPAQGRRGRKPPPYPHNRLSERGRKAKEPRQAPPYPEKRRLLSTTV